MTLVTEDQNGNIEIKEEEEVIFDIETLNSPDKETKHLNYILNENKAITKMKSNLERGGVKVMDTAKKEPKLLP